MFQNNRRMGAGQGAGGACRDAQGRAGRVLGRGVMSLCRGSFGGGGGSEGEFDVEAVGGGAVDVGDAGIFHGVFGDERLTACDHEADALAGMEAGREGEFKFESGVGAGAEDAGVVAVGEQVEDFDGVGGGGIGEVVGEGGAGLEEGEGGIEAGDKRVCDHEPFLP